VSLILLDFDGPVVRLLPDPEHLQLAERLVRWWADRTGEIFEAAAIDHVAVLRRIHQSHPDVAAEAESMATTQELAAAASREAYPDAIGAMRRWLADGGRLAIVSNNAEQAVRRVLARTGLPAEAYTVHARQPEGIGHLKPGPNLLLQAMNRHGASASRTVMIGDTVGDVLAGQAAGVRTIGVAESAGRAEDLRRAGAVAVITRLTDLQTPASHT
jgi:HAD superfamily hydrolase (TIGR01662 family)